jgi:hypothetical protein
MAKPGTSSNRPGDVFARPAAESLAPTFTARKLSALRPGFTLADLKGETSTPFMKGFTTNHELQVHAGRYCQSPEDPESRSILLYYLGPYYVSVIGYEGKEFMSSSHCGHYYACYGPILHAALRASDREMVRLVTLVWKRLLAAAHLFAYYNRELDQWRIVAPCARVHLAPQEHADQRVEMVATFEWLATGKLPVKLPDWARKALASSDPVKVPPSILGLYALIQVQRAFEQDLPWAREWPRVLQEIRSAKYPDDLPPVAYRLIVLRGESWHRGEILDNQLSLRNASFWAYADHASGTELYDYPTGKSILRAVNWDDKTVKQYNFPLARRGNVKL